MNPLFVGIDVSSKSNVAYLMKPDGSKYSSFSVQNNLGGAKILSEKIVSALHSMQLSDVVIGLEATSIYGDSLVYALREDGSLGRFQRKIHNRYTYRDNHNRFSFSVLPSINSQERHRSIRSFL